MPNTKTDTTLKLWPGLTAEPPPADPASPMQRAVLDLDAAVTTFRARCTTLPFGGRRASSQSGERERVRPPIASVK